jgi:hypothetical protein
VFSASALAKVLINQQILWERLDLAVAVRRNSGAVKNDHSQVFDSAQEKNVKS